MNDRQAYILALRDTDVEGAVKRCCNNEQFYIKCLREFLDDSTMSELNKAVVASDWDKAFDAAHALKGLAGNMGFVPLMHSTSMLVILIRGGRINDVAASLEDVNSAYRDITDGIHQFFAVKN